MSKEEMVISKRALTPREVSKIYGIAEGTLANMRAQRRGAKYFKINKKVLYRIEDIESFLFQNPVLTTDTIERTGK